MNQFRVGDPSVTLKASVAFSGNSGWLRFLNYSPYGLDLTLNRGTFRLYPYSLRDVQVDVTETLNWTVILTLLGASGASSDLTIEAYDENEPRPPLPPGYACPLVNIGNTPNVTVIANQLGSSAEGLTVQFQGAIPGDYLLPYSSTAGVSRDLLLAGLLNGSLNALIQLSMSANRVSLLGTAALLVPGLSSLDNAALITDGAGSIATMAGTVKQYSGVATAGKGLPAIVASTNGVAVSVTTQQTILSYTPAADGVYKCNGRFRINNGTSGQLVLFEVQYTDADSGAAAVTNFTGNGGGATEFVFGASPSITNGVYSCSPRVIKAKASTAISIVYRDPGGTPADNVSASIQWMS